MAFICGVLPTRLETMKHEYHRTEDQAFLSAGIAPAWNDADASPSHTETNATDQALAVQQYTWENWKSVRDVG
jgi:hypothetical protein